MARPDRRALPNASGPDGGNPGGAPMDAFGAGLRVLRMRCGLSQSLLARLAAINPSYIHRLEAQRAGGPLRPSRTVVLRLYAALLGVGEEVGAPIEDDDRERLLVAAGWCPEVIVRAGGWDGYRLGPARGGRTDGPA
jgi:transcriptional regulator with XRE-family HTH domain